VEFSVQPASLSLALSLSLSLFTRYPNEPLTR
jgi:hypothetical protein